MYKLLIFACILAVAVAAPKPQVFFSPYSAPYTDPISYSTYYAPFTYSLSSPFIYPAAPVSTYSVYPYSAYSSPYTLYYK